MTILTELRRIALERSRGLPSEDFTLHGQWAFDLMFCPNPGERVFEHTVLLLQTMAQGCCYCALGKPVLDKNMMGRDAREIIAPNSDYEIALLDAIYSVFEHEYEEEFTIKGTSAHKAHLRSEIVVNEVLRLAQTLNLGRPAKVVHVGVVGNILKLLSESGLQVFATDLDPDLVNHSLHSVDIMDGARHNLALIADCDLALITGMTLATGTLDAIMDTARANNTRLVMFAETGAWLGREYCRSFGIDAVISEPFPFYIFEGTSTLRVHRAR